MAHIGQRLARSGHVWPHLGRVLPQFAQIGPTFAKFGRSLPALGQLRPSTARSWPTSVDVGRCLGEHRLPDHSYGNVRATCWQLAASFGATLRATAELAGAAGGTIRKRIASNLSATFGRLYCFCHSRPLLGTPPSHRRARGGNAVDQSSGLLWAILVIDIATAEAVQYPPSPLSTESRNKIPPTQSAPRRGPPKL